MISVLEKNYTTLQRFEYTFPLENRLVAKRIDKISTLYCRILLVGIYLAAPMDIMRSKSIGIFLELYSNRIIPHFAVLFLPSNDEENSTMCMNKFENSVPFLRNMKCSTSYPLDDLLSLYSMTRMPSDWAVEQYHNFKENKAFFTSARYIADAILVQHLNYTLKWSDHRNSKECTKFRLKPKCFRLMILPELPDILTYIATGTPVTIESREYAFLTCHYREDLSFRFYTNPFETTVWVGIAVSLMTLIVLGEAYVAIKFNQFRFTVTFYMWATVFEQSSRVTSAVSHTNFFRALVVVWLVSVTRLTSSYLSLVISSLNSPSVPTFPKTLQDVSCSNKKQDIWFVGQTWLARNQIVSEAFNEKQLFTESETKRCFKILSPPLSTGSVVVGNVVHRDVLIWSFMLYLYKAWTYLSRSDTWNLLSYQMLRKEQSFYPNNEVVSFPAKNKTAHSIMSSIEEELVHCGKSIFFDSSRNVRLWFSHLSSSYHWLKFSVAKIPYFPTQVGWSFETYDGTKSARVQKLFVNIFETGILYRAKNMESELEFQTRRMTSTRSIIQSMIRNGLKHNREKRGQKMGGSIDTIFIVWGMLLLMSGIVFVLELISRLHFHCSKLKNRTPKIITGK
ncbi:hypothetical protein Fcan01_15746 [Folsomia candida]|uniref:Uncharacterized protein n=1 Tax=Folsomia candida TaxID=158441 RepID=A0A226DVU4_FOLCA|nr:hypothetical protein Fcan01_15746 [Folsomia candida]